MDHLLSIAQRDDASAPALMLTLICGGIAIITTIAAAIPAVIAAHRGRRKTESLLAACVVWACLTLASLIYTTMMQRKWAAERDLRISTGYYDPQNTSDAPPLPIGQWGMLGVGYVALVVWGASRGPRREG